MRRLILACLVLLAWPAVAAAQMATFLQTATDETDASSYNFTLQNIGAQVSDRMIVVVIAGRKTGAGGDCEQPAAVTVGGNAATHLVTRWAPDATVTCNVMSMWAVMMPGGGTTATVSVGMGDTMLRCHIALYRALVGAGTLPTVFATGSSIADDPTGTLTIPANGFAVGGSFSSNTGTVTWTGLTEQFEGLVGTTASMIVSGALLTPSTLQSGITVTADWSAFLNSVGVWASWDAAPSGGTHVPTTTLLGVGGGS